MSETFNFLVISYEYVLTLRDRFQIPNRSTEIDSFDIIQQRDDIKHPPHFQHPICQFGSLENRHVEKFEIRYRNIRCLTMSHQLSLCLSFDHHALTSHSSGQQNTASTIYP